MSFTFFTTLSNVALDIILIIFIVLDIILLKTGKDYKNNKLYILKWSPSAASNMPQKASKFSPFRPLKRFLKIPRISYALRSDL